MLKSNQPKFKLHQINLGDVLVFDTDHTLEKGGRYDVRATDWRPNRPAYELRVEEVVMNGANSFIIIGPVVNFIHGDGTYFTPEETATYQASEVARIEKMSCGESTQSHFISEVSRPHINLSHAIRRVSVGKGDAHPITKPTKRGFSSFNTVVFNEAVRYFRGRVPTNLDFDYLSYLLRNQERKYPWGYSPEKWTVLYNVKKFREAFRRNVNRALMNSKDMEAVAGWSSEESSNLDMVSLFDKDRLSCEQERDDIRATFSELAQRWEVFESRDFRNIRFDRLTHPKADYATGLSARDVFNRAYRDIRNRIDAEHRADEEKLAQQGSCYDSDYDRRDYDNLVDLIEDDVPYVPEPTRVAAVKRVHRAASIDPAPQATEDEFPPLDGEF